MAQPSGDTPAKKMDEGVKWVPLSSQGFPRVFFRLVKEKSTGLLYLTSGEQRITVVFQKGAPVFANSNSAETNLGSILASRGVIPREKLEDAVTQAKAAGKQLGTILVQKGLLSNQDLAQYLSEQIRSILLKVFSWEGGYYHIDLQPIGNREALMVFKNPLEVVVAGIRQGYSLNRLLKEGLKQEVGLSNRDVGKDAPLFQDLVWGQAIERIRPLIDGRRSIKQIAERSELEASEALKAIFTLLVLEQVVEVEAAKSEPAPHPKPRPAPAVEDSGPEIIGPETNERVDAAIVEPPRGASGSFEIAPGPVLKPSERIPASQAPTILGDVDHLEKTYQAKQVEKKPEPAAASSSEDPTFEDPAGEITLDDIPLKPPARASEKKKASDPGEITVEPSAPSPKKVKKEEAPAKKPAEAPAVRAAGASEAAEIPLGKESAMKRFAKLAGVAVLSSVVLLGSIGLFVYVDPDQALRALDRIRLLKMYGQPTLDARRLAQFYEDDGQLKAARLNFERALDQNANDDRLELSLAKVLIRLEEWEAAKKHLAAILSRNPALTEAHLGLGWCFLHDGEVAKAKREFYLFLSASSISPQTESVRKLVQGLQ